MLPQTNRQTRQIVVGLVIAAAVVTLVSGATHYVRHATVDYLLGSLMGLSLVVMLVIPFFKDRLLTAKEE